MNRPSNQNENHTLSRKFLKPTDLQPCLHVALWIFGVIQLSRKGIFTPQEESIASLGYGANGR